MSPVTRRITETQYREDIADAERRGFEKARQRLEGEAPERLTRADVTQMTTDQINERWDEVSEVLARKEPAEGEGAA